MSDDTRWVLVEDDQVGIIEIIEVHTASIWRSPFRDWQMLCRRTAPGRQSDFTFRDVDMVDTKRTALNLAAKMLLAEKANQIRVCPLTDGERVYYDKTLDDERRLGNDQDTP